MISKICQIFQISKLDPFSVKKNTKGRLKPPVRHSCFIEIAVEVELKTG